MTTELLNSNTGKSSQKRQSLATKVVNLGLFANSILAVTKLSAGIFGHSQALLADGINSISDVVYFIVVKIFVTLSGKPADHEHPYGHHQFESIAALVVGAFVITTGIAIFWDSIHSIFDYFSGITEEKTISFFALWVSLGTIIIKIFLLIHAKSINSKTDSLAVAALLADHRNDIIASMGASIGIIFGLSGMLWVDPLAGAIVAIIVTKTGIDILRESSKELMDTVPGTQIDKKIRNVLSYNKDILSIEEIHAHRFGPYFMVNITIGIDGNITVTQGDAIADSVEFELKEKFDLLRKVYVHYHPG